MKSTWLIESNSWDLFLEMFVLFSSLEAVVYASEP